MDIKEARIGQKVMTKTGRIGTVDAISSDSVYVMFGSSVCVERMRAGDLTPVSDPCASCEMAATITSQCKQIADLQVECAAWKRNAAYWREELTKLQNESLECKPMSEVAKIYIQVSPDKLLMSQAARRVVEYMTAMDRPLYIGGILEGMKDIMPGMAIMDGIMEARDAGKIALVNGKYEIVRD